ncbi:hypothetical protein SAMN05216462_0297 [Xylanibacter ruminicola]|uniref:Uncharacterized protein n=1 Tax=Xylanibacter ruminicola TaxID=839 RepID=A0A1H3XP03_XYLRU|nr:hypothetical protein [Xylanibacter ruminicola]SEA01103.1 hypothetical protein SAMN05216462_0297 [Xylanibacter ruminicola]
METQILNLKEPYEYIYCNGSIGLHIATLIVYEAGVNNDGEYVLETHSHPVVKYANRPGGTVWNRAELTDCHVLCREDNKRITMEQFHAFMNEIGFIHLEDKDEGLNLPMALEVPIWKSAFDTNGIEIEWPMMTKRNGDKEPIRLINVPLEFKRNPEGSKYKYSCKESFDASFTAENDVPLYFSLEFNTKNDLKAGLRNGMSAYYRAFKNHEFKIWFGWFDDCEFVDVLEELISKSEEIRQECFEDDDV